jgi:hypothetical protein
VWTLSGFADEIDPDPATQCQVLRELAITHIELRSAWDVNVVDWSDEQLSEVESVLAAYSISVSSIGSPSARSTSRTTSTRTCGGWTGP